MLSQNDDIDKVDVECSIHLFLMQSYELFNFETRTNLNSRLSLSMTR